MKNNLSKADSSDQLIRSIDISEVEFDENGIINFYWPLDNRKSAELMIFLTKKLIPYITNYEKKHSELTAIRLLYKWFLCEVLSQFEATILVTQFRNDDIKPIIPKHYKKIEALYNSNPLECLFFLNLCSGPSYGRKIPKALKRIGKEFLWNGIDLKLLRKYGSNPNDVLSIGPSNLTILHARGKRKLLRYSEFTEWFRPISQSCILNKSDTLTGIQNLLTIIKEGFSSSGFEILPVTLEYLSSWVNQANNFVDFHLNDRNYLIDKIRDEVWFGCGGNSIWHVIMIEKLRRKKIKVVTHDHGSGCAHHEQTPAHWVEFLHTDQFVTHNRINEETKKSALKQELIFGKKLPLIESLDSALNKPCEDNDVQCIKVKGKIKKVMYVGTSFKGERTRLRPIFHDMTYFDWQIKLLSHLKKNMVDVIYKPHPEGATSPPHDFAESFGFQSITKKFEKINDNVDAYIIDFIFSSTTPRIFETRKPVFFFDLGFPEILPNALELIKKSCYYSEVKYSADSKLSNDFKEFDQFIKNDEHVFDTSFPDLYFKNI